MADLLVCAFGQFKVDETVMAAVIRVFYSRDGEVQVSWERFERDNHWHRYPPVLSES